jgi:two-component system CAI-1 autoinducer sensor kinase/phosphatase CqsS
MKRFKAFLQGALREGTWISTHTILTAAAIGTFGHGGFYFLFKYGFHLPYESFPLRLTATALCVFPLLTKMIPRLSIGRFMPIYWHAMLIFVLPFIFTVYLLKSNFHELWLYWEIFMVFILIIHTPHWFMFLFDLTAGIFGALVFFALTDSFANLTPHFSVPLYGIVFLFSIVAGLIFQASNKKLLQDTEQAIRLAMSALAGSIAHEMRNPLGQVKYSLDHIDNALPNPSMQQTSHPLPAKNLDDLYQHLSQGQLAIRRGLQVIAMTLDEVKGKAPNPARFSYLSAEQTVRKAVDEYGYETEGERRKISVAVMRDFTFKGDETVVIFVLFNLLKNALYYFKTRPQATIQITVDGQVIRVRDTGPGIAPETLAQLFEAFMSIDKTHGTGLGLSYCKRSMQAFGGDIGCVSIVDQFTEFTLSFPIISSVELTQYENEVFKKAKASFAGKRFLIVDDIELVRHITAHHLNHLGAEILQAQDGQDAIEKLQAFQFDLILMDLNMPVLDGYAAVEKIRAGVVPSQQDIPIVAFTTEAAFVAQVKTQKVGINGFLSKPCTRFDLILTLHQILEESAKKPALSDMLSIADLAGKSVLAVDDEALNRITLKRYLGRAHITVVEAEHGAQALEYLAQNHFDLLLMDMQMPGLSGIETIKKIRQTPSAYQQVKIVMLSANFDESSMGAAYAAGANEFMTKPIALDPQYEEIRRLLRDVDYLDDPGRKHESVAASTAAPSEIQKASTPLLNPQTLAALKDSLLLQDVFPLFERQAEQWMQLLEQSLSSKNIHQANQVLHAYKGACGSIGAQALHETIRHVYQVTQQGDWPQEDDWLTAMQTLQTQTLKALREHMAVH